MLLQGMVKITWQTFPEALKKIGGEVLGQFLASTSVQFPGRWGFEHAVTLRTLTFFNHSADRYLFLLLVVGD